LKGRREEREGGEGEGRRGGKEKGEGTGGWLSGLTLSNPRSFFEAVICSRA
jgi:hypothetical protein